MVSKASEDLPEPLKPVITTSLSRGIFSVRFLRLCSRAPPILMNSLLTDSKFPTQTIDKHTGNRAKKQSRSVKIRGFILQRERPQPTNARAGNLPGAHWTAAAAAFSAGSSHSQAGTPRRI